MNKFTFSIASFVLFAAVAGMATVANADGEGEWGIIDTYYPDSGIVDTYYPEYGNVDTYYPEYGIVDTYYDDYGIVDTYYNDYGIVDTYYGSGCGYSCGSYGGYSNPGCYGCGGSSYRPSTGGGYYMTYPTVTQGARPSGGGGGSQSQTQSQVSNNTNTNTNVNINNNTAVAVAQVQIGSQQAQTPTYSQPAPYCTINQAQSYSQYGVNPVYLSWNSSNAQQAYLSSYGSVGVSGSQTVYPTYTTTYTLTVYGYNGQQATCQTTVYANSYTPTYTPPAQYVSLTQIPYTGFDFGPFGNAMYWAGLAVFALGGAYLAIYYIPMVFTGRKAYANSFAKRQFAPVVAPKAPVLLEKEAVAAKVAPIVESLRKAGTTDSMAIVHVNGSMPKIVVARD